jgi:hypothetical protein
MSTALASHDMCSPVANVRPSVLIENAAHKNLVHANTSTPEQEIKNILNQMKFEDMPVEDYRGVLLTGVCSERAPIKSLLKHMMIKQGEDTNIHKALEQIRYSKSTPQLFQAASGFVLTALGVTVLMFNSSGQVLAIYEGFDKILKTAKEEDEKFEKSEQRPDTACL